MRSKDTSARAQKAAALQQTVLTDVGGLTVGKWLEIIFFHYAYALQFSCQASLAKLI